MGNLLAEHHASSQSGTLPPELAQASRILASASSELSGSMIVSVIVPASIYQRLAHWKGLQSSGKMKQIQNILCKVEGKASKSHRV